MTDRLDVTDGWHPTVNPSARMPVHHFRFVETLGHRDGLLNEFPRRRGGSTLRLIRFADGDFHVVDLPGTLEWVGWWLPARDPRVAQSITRVFQEAIRHGEGTQTERKVFERTLALFETACGSSDGPTVGEVLTQVNDQLSRELIPRLPHLSLISLTRSPARTALASALATVKGGLANALGRWADTTNLPMWPLVAVATDPDGFAQRVRFHVEKRCFDMAPLLADDHRSRTSRSLSVDDIVVLLHQGRLVPGARLIALAEANLAAQGATVHHYGNTYGHTQMAGRLLGVPAAAAIATHADDADSWHYAAIQSATNIYPLHLHDVLACDPEAKAVVADLVTASLRQARPILLRPKESLNATLLAGRPGLLRQEDGSAPR